MVASTTKSSKRKSIELTEQSLKKIKVAKSADRPQPTKSALKKTASTPVVTESKDVDEPLAVQKSNASNIIEEGSAVQKSKSSKDGSAKSTKKAKAVQESFNSDEEDEATTMTADQTEALMAGFTDSEDDDEEEDGIPVDKLPKAPLQGLPLNASGALTIAADPESTPGVIYIGRVPHGFYEKQMRAYFSQFGEITHLRLARSKKTAKSQHHAFLEFASSAVADIVTKTMDKYLLFNHILQVRRVPSEQVKDTMWKGEGKRRRAMPLNRIEGTRLNKGTTREGWEKRISRESARRQSKANKLKELGYEFEAPTLKSLSAQSGDETAAITPDQQLLGDVQSAAEEAPKNAASTTKKRTASKVDESRGTKKNKSTK